MGYLEAETQTDAEILMDTTTAERPKQRPERMLRWFKYWCARSQNGLLPAVTRSHRSWPERTVARRKLLEGKGRRSQNLAG